MSKEESSAAPISSLDTSSPMDGIVIDDPSSASSFPVGNGIDSRSVFLRLDDRSLNPVEEAGPNHFERPSPQLSSLEHFYVNVARIFAEEQELKQKKAAELAAAAKDSNATATTFLSRDGSILDNLKRARFQLDNLCDLLDSCLGKEKLTLSERTADRYEGNNEDEEQRLQRERVREEEKLQSEDEEEKSYSVSRRNRIALITQMHITDYANASKVLAHAQIKLANTLKINRQLHHSLSHLATHFLLRYRLQPISRIRGNSADQSEIELMADLGLEGLKGRGGRIKLSNKNGRVKVEGQIGMMGKEEKDATIRRKRRKEMIQSTKDRHSNNVIISQMDMDTEAKSNSLLSLPPSSSSSSSRFSGSWRECAIRLQRAQHQLLNEQIYTRLMNDAKLRSAGSHSLAHPPTAAAGGGGGSAGAAGITATHGQFIPPSSISFTSSILNGTITISSAAFPSFTIAFPQGQSHPFLLKPESSPHLSLLLHHSCRSILLVELQRNAPSNRPLLLSLSANPDQWKEEQQELLSHIVYTVYHRLLIAEINKLLNNYKTRRELTRLRIEYHNSNLLNRYGCTIYLKERFVCQLSIEGTNLYFIAPNPPPYKPFLAQTKQKKEQQEEKEKDNSNNENKETPQENSSELNSLDGVGVPLTYLQFARHVNVTGLPELRHLISTAIVQANQ